MSERKNIDRLFQEKFKDFEAVPSEKVWENIQRRLDEDKKKKAQVLPLWLRFCGAAAVLLIGFSIVTTFLALPSGYTPNGSGTGVVSIEKEGNPANTSATKENASGISNSKEVSGTQSVGAESIQNKTNAVAGSFPSGTTSEGSIKHPSGKDANSVNSDSKSDWNGLSEKSKADTEHSANKFALVKNHRGLAVAHHGKNTSKNTSKSEMQHKSAAVATDANQLVQNAIASEKNPASENIQKNATVNSGKEGSIIHADSEITTNNSLAVVAPEDLIYEENTSKVAHEAGKGHFVKSKKDRKSNDDSTIPVLNEQKANNKTTNNAAVATTIIKEDKTINKALSNNTAVTNNDSLAKAKGKSEPNPLDELLKEKEDTKKEDKKKSSETRWAANPKVSPIYMKASGANSAIDPQFDNNNRTYQTSFSYGMGINYAVNKKLTVRTGVNKLSMQYSTDGVVYYDSKNVKAMENVRRNATGSSIQIEDGDSRSLAFSGNNIVTQRSSGSLTQKMGYIEVPVELSYKVLNKKFGIDVIGGMSTMFLDENKISLLSANQDVVIGEAKNLNNIHLSSNFGLGFRYNFSKAVEANFEPMVKYQFNTYSSNAGDFKPYFFGLYTGISYRF